MTPTIQPTDAAALESQWQTRMLDALLAASPGVNDGDVLRLVRSGITIRVFEVFAARLHLPDALILSKASITRRHIQQKRLTLSESDFLVRVVRVVGLVGQLTGDERSAIKWMGSPLFDLAESPGTSALELLRTSAGAKIVETMVRRTANGIY